MSRSLNYFRDHFFNVGLYVTTCDLEKSFSFEMTVEIDDSFFGDWTPKIKIGYVTLTTPIWAYFYSAPQCSHCKRCTSYGNSVRLSVRLSVIRRCCVKTTARSTVQFALSNSKMCLVL